MVWLLIAIPLSSVVMGIIMITLAISSNDGLVVDDYYKKGLEINQTLERDARASVLGLVAKLEFEVENNRIRLRITGRDAFQAPEQIILGLYHATLSEGDQTISLRRDTRGTYTAPLPTLTPGRWYISLENEKWRLTHTINYPYQGIVEIAHHPINS